MSARRAAPLALALACLALAPAAPAAYDPLGSGEARLLLDKGFRASLAEHGVKLRASESARLRGAAAIFPVAGGKLDPTIGKGAIELAGRLTFSTARKRLGLDQIMVRTEPAPLLAKLGGGQLKIGSRARIGFRRVGFGARFSAREVRLTAKAATRLNKRLRLGEAFAAGQRIGDLLLAAQPATATVLSRGRATLLLAPEILAKLDRLFVSANPIHPAERVGASFTFPIIPEGTIAPQGGAGVLRAGGDIELLQLSGGQIFWHEFWLDFAARLDSAEVEIQPSPPYPGKLGRVGLFEIGAAAFEADPRARAVSVSAPLALQAAAAAAMNQAFAAGEEVFRAGEPLGTVSFTARTQ